MALGASCWTGRFAGFLRFIMAAFAVLMESVLRRRSLSLFFGFMTINAQFASGLALLPGVVALCALVLHIDVFLMRKCHLPIGRIKFDHVFCKNATDHQNG